MGYALTNSFGALNFIDPVCMVTPPGETNRLFVVERGGDIAVITNLAAPERTVFLNISNKVTYVGEGGLLSLVFHPGYATNGYFYVWYYGPDSTSQGTGTHDILARYQVSATNANFAAPNTEVKFIRQYDDNQEHNGGDMHFGPQDGYLYLALGDEGQQYSADNNDQRIDKNFYSALMRIDVDQRPGNLPPNAHPAATTNYLVPADNPFVGATNFDDLPVNPANVRTEFWAVGFRHPWRWNFDEPSRLLYLADVGQDTQEEIDIVVKGGNYGWAYREGLIPGPKAAPLGFTSIDPIMVYTHGLSTNQGYAIIGGLVYRGTELSQLTGNYVFGDNVSGNLWAIKYDGTNVSNWQLLLSTAVGLSTFGTDPRNGDILVATRDVEGGSNFVQPLRRLVYSASSTGQPLPPTLADTGAFADTTALAPSTGVVPYDINVPFWSDNAIKSRWFSLPDTNLTLGFDASNSWSLPAGTVWIKHFDLVTNTVPLITQRIETRLLVRNSNGVYGVTYRWGGSATNAALVPEGGMDDTLEINDGGTLRTQVWHYPSRAECLACHTAAGGYALGFNTPQMNRDINYSGAVTNQLTALSDAGYFSSPVGGFHTFRALAAPTNTAASLEYRVRSYLAANCVQCHQPGGSAGWSLWDARLLTPTSRAGIINGTLVDNLGDTNNAVVKPGSPGKSVMFTRLANPGQNHMPPLATSLINTQAVQLLSDWITNDLPNYQDFTDWQLAYFGTTNGANVGATGDYDGDGAGNYLEYLTGTNPTNSASHWTFNLAVAGVVDTVSFLQVANCGFEVLCTTNLRSPITWTPLDQPGNEPFFWRTNRAGKVQDPQTTVTKYYRMRVFVP